MSARFARDPAFERQLLTSPAVEVIVADRGEAVAERARELAPDDPTTAGSRIADGIGVDVETVDGRRVAHVHSGFPGPFHEFGTSRHPARPFLRPAAEQVVGPLSGEHEG